MIRSKSSILKFIATIAAGACLGAAAMVALYRAQASRLRVIPTFSAEAGAENYVFRTKNGVVPFKARFAGDNLRLMLTAVTGDPKSGAVVIELGDKGLEQIVVSDTPGGGILLTRNGSEKGGKPIRLTLHVPQKGNALNTVLVDNNWDGVYETKVDGDNTLLIDNDLDGVYETKVDGDNGAAVPAATK